MAELYRILLRMSHREAQRLGAGLRLSSPELVDVASSSLGRDLDDLSEGGDVPGDCRFTTWAYQFVVFDVGSKINRHPWRRPTVPFHDHDWNLPSPDLNDAP